MKYSTLYKYMRREFAISLVENGVLLLSPLSAFADETNLGKEIGDYTEGTSTVTGQNVHLRPESPIPQSLQPNFQQGVWISARNIVAVKKTEDVLIFCTTQKFKKKLMSDFGYNTCVAITQPDRFFQCITSSMNDEYIFQGYHACVYGSRKNDYLKTIASVPEYLLKEPRYSHQREVRAIWKHRESHPVTEAMLITCGGVKEYCHIHYEA